MLIKYSRLVLFKNGCSTTPFCFGRSGAKGEGFENRKYAIALVNNKTEGQFPTPKVGLNIGCGGTLDCKETIHMENTTNRKKESQDRLQTNPIIKIKKTLIRTHTVESSRN